MENEVIISTKATSQLRKIDQRYMNAIKTKIAMLKNFPDVYLDMNTFRQQPVSDETW